MENRKKEKLEKEKKIANAVTDRTRSFGQIKQIPTICIQE